MKTATTTDKIIQRVVFSFLVFAASFSTAQTTVFTSGFETGDPALTYLAGTINTPALLSAGARTGTRCGGFSANGKYDGAFVTSSINFVACRTYVITMYYKVATCAGGLDIRFTTDNSSYTAAAAGTLLTSVTTNQVAYTAVTYTYTPSTTTAGYIAFVSTMTGNGCNSANFWIDDILITEDAGAPVAGTASASATSLACGGNTTSLSVSGNSGSPAVLEWQSSSNGTTWADMEVTSNPYVVTVYGSMYYRAKVSKNCSTVYTNTLTITVTGSSTKTWLTTGTNSWTTASNWNPSGVPTSCHDVVIPSGGTQPTLIGTGNCKSLTINAGAVLTNGTSLINGGTLNIYGNFINNGTINDANGYEDLYGQGNWGGTGVFSSGSQEGWVRIKNGANYTLTSSGITVAQLNPGGAATTGHLNLGSNTIVVTSSLYNTFYLHYNTGMVDLRGGGSIDVTKSDYGTGTLYVNSSVNGFNFNLEDDYYNVWFTNSAGTTKFGSSALDVYVANNLWVKITGTLDLSSAGFNAIHVGGDFTNDANFVASTATIVMDGTKAQYINGSSITTFNNLTINNSTASGVTMQQDENVSGILTLTKGPLNLNSRKLTVTNGLATAVTRTTGYVVSETNASVNPSIFQWNMGTNTGAHVYPFGVSGTYIPFTFNKTSGGAANISVSTRASVSNNTPWAGSSNVGAVAHMYDPTLLADGSIPAVIDRWWDITASAATTANLTFSYRGSENTLSSTYNTGTLGAQHWNGTGWDIPVGSGAALTSGVGTVNVSGASTFSPWVLSAAAAPLPIRLLSFTAELHDEIVALEWETASELNNDYFEVEKSLDGKTFSYVGSLKGAGTSDERKSYSLNDPNPYSGRSYYRLKQVDYDGRSSYSPLAAINIDKSLGSLNVFPNPSDGSFSNVVFEAPFENDYQLTVYDVSGRLILDKSVHANAGSNQIGLDVSGMDKGVYFMVVKDHESSLKTKFLIE
jgi:hypothetical protein